MPFNMPAEELMDNPLPSSQVRILYCMICGAIIYIRFGGNDEGIGDPDLHKQYHADRGEIAE